MLKTQITGAKYLSPQTNQMTNLNIAVPADSKDTKFGTSDILLAKDVVAYLNALDSDISKELDAQTDKINKINKSIKQLIDHNLIKIVTELPTTDIDKNCIYLVPNKDGEGNNIFIEYIYVESKNTFEEVGRIQAKVDLSGYYTKEETDNLILIAKNSAINIHNEDNSKSIKLDINDTEAADKYSSEVNISLIDSNYNANINAVDGFRHSSSDENFSNLYSDGLDINNEFCTTNIYSGQILMSNYNASGSIEMNTNIEQTDGSSSIDISLSDGDCEANINAKNGFTIIDGANEANIDASLGFTHKTDDGFVTKLDGYTLNMEDFYGNVLHANSASIDFIDKKNKTLITINSDELNNYLCIGSDEKFKLSRPTDNTEGATITGVKSLTAFSNPSATKVWATDGSTVDLTTKANASDILLKKSASGGYYIEANSNELGLGAFAASSECTASGTFAYAEGGAIASGDISHAECGATASGMGAHAECNSTASGDSSHAEGSNTNASGSSSHTEGDSTIASGYCSHALGCYNIKNINAIHSVGVGNNTTRKNAEYIYAKNYKDDTDLTDDPKNGYKYLIGVGGYDGISTDNSTYKSVQEVIADLTARIEQLETKVRALEAANTPA